MPMFKIERCCFYGLTVVVAYILVYGTGLLGSFLFQKMLETQSFPGNLNKKINMLIFVTYFLFLVYNISMLYRGMDCCLGIVSWFFSVPRVV